MKRTTIILALFIIPFLAGAQDFIDEVFNKYSGSDNFTSIVIGKDLLDFAFSMDKDNEIDKLKGKISDLKILVSNDQHESGNIGFTNEIRSALEKNNYLSLMEIKDGKDKVNFYVKKDNDIITHLILLAKEENEEILLSLKGQFSKKDLAELGKCTKHEGSFHHLSYLKSVDK